MSYGKPAATMIRDLATGAETAITQLLRFPRWSGDGKLIIGTKIKEPWSYSEIPLCPVDGGLCGALTRGYHPHWASDGSSPSLKPLTL